MGSIQSLGNHRRENEDMLYRTQANSPVAVEKRKRSRNKEIIKAI